jgi:hypothetical protein
MLRPTWRRCAEAGAGMGLQITHHITGDRERYANRDHLYR